MIDTRTLLFLSVYFTFALSLLHLNTFPIMKLSDCLSNWSEGFLLLIVPWTLWKLYILPSSMFSVSHALRQQGLTVWHQYITYDKSLCSSGSTASFAKTLWHCSCSPCRFTHSNSTIVASQRGLRKSSNALCNSSILLHEEMMCRNDEPHTFSTHFLCSQNHPADR